jgi:hypothetical protein
MARNSTIASVFRTMAMPMMLKTTVSNGVAALKCEVVPRADCMVMSAISMAMAEAMVHRTTARAPGRAAVSGMNHAMVHRNTVIEIMNLAGFSHGLTPRIWRVSPMDSSVTTTSMSSMAAPVQNSSGSR